MSCRFARPVQCIWICNILKDEKDGILGLGQVSRF